MPCPPLAVPTERRCGEESHGLVSALKVQRPSQRYLLDPGSRLTASDQLPWRGTTSADNPTLLASQRSTGLAKPEEKTTLAGELFSLQQLMGSHVQAAKRLADQVAQLQDENRRLSEQLATASQQPMLPKDRTDSSHCDVESYGGLQRAGTDPCFSATTIGELDPHKKLQHAAVAGIVKRAGTQPNVSFKSPHPSLSTTALQPTRQRERGPSLRWPSFDHISSNNTRTTKQSADTQKSSKQAAWPVFTDTHALKDRIKEVLSEEQHDITEHYHSSGSLQKIARSLAFEQISAFMVVLSALWLSIEIDHDNSSVLSEADPIFQVAAHFFCAFFLFEFIIRFGTFREKRRALQEITILFDAGLLALLIFETWIVPITMAISGASIATSGRRGQQTVIVFRALRVLRTLRLARVLRQVQELLVIVRGIAIAFRALTIILALLAFVIYFAAIVFTILLQDTELGMQRFSSVPASMGTLLLEGTLSGSRGTQVIREANDEHPVFASLLLIFVLLANVTVMGVLAGLLVQTVKTVSEVEKEEVVVRSITDKMDELWEQVVVHDDNCDGLIDIHELPCLLSDETLAKSLHSVGIDLEGLVDISSLHLQQHAYMTKPQFKRMALELRSKEVAKVKDHVETRKFIHTHFQDFTTWSRARRAGHKV